MFWNRIFFFFRLLVFKPDDASAGLLSIFVFGECGVLVVLVFNIFLFFHI